MKFAEIEIGGKVRTIRFGLKPIGECIKHYDGDLEQFLQSIEKNPFEAVPTLVYYGAKWGVEQKGQLPDFTIADAYVWIEESEKGLQSEEVETVVQLFIRSVYDNVPRVKEVIDNMDEESKKNLIGT